MKKTWVCADMSKFVVFILTHGRPRNQKTIRSLRNCGYTGRVILVLDNEDDTIDEYYKIFGESNIYVFDKEKYAKQTDIMLNTNKRDAIIFARNACWDIAEELGYEYFVQLDDDYKYFAHKNNKNGITSRHLDDAMKIFVEFLLNTNENVKTIAFSQEGEHLGGWKGDIYFKRKAMNSFFCLTNRRFKFIGLINEDVNTYTLLGSRGDIFLTYMVYSLKQETTQESVGGMSGIYKQLGTYVKTFFTVMAMPSCVKVKMMPSKHGRLHHAIKWNHCVPKIIKEKYKKL